MGTSPANQHLRNMNRFGRDLIEVLASCYGKSLQPEAGKELSEVEEILAHLPAKQREMLANFGYVSYLDKIGILPRRVRCNNCIAALIEASYSVTNYIAAQRRRYPVTEMLAFL